MNYSLLFTQEANIELVEAVEMLESLNTISSNRFIIQVEHTQKTILTFPKSYPILIHQYRKAVIKGFPYVLVYEILEDLGIVLVVAVFYTRRNIDKLKARLE